MANEDKLSDSLRAQVQGTGWTRHPSQITPYRRYDPRYPASRIMAMYLEFIFPSEVVSGSFFRGAIASSGYSRLSQPPYLSNANLTCNVRFFLFKGKEGFPLVWNTTYFESTSFPPRVFFSFGNRVLSALPNRRWKLHRNKDRQPSESQMKAASWLIHQV